MTWERVFSLMEENRKMTAKALSLSREIADVRQRTIERQEEALRRILSIIQKGKGKEVTYRNENLERVKEILEGVRCEPYIIEAFPFHGNPENKDIYLQVRKWRADTHTREMGWGRGAKYYISEHALPSEVAQRAIRACLDFAEHEIREAFQYRGRRIFGPHLNHDLLWKIAEEEERRTPPPSPLVPPNAD